MNNMKRLLAEPSRLITKGLYKPLTLATVYISHMWPPGDIVCIAQLTLLGGGLLSAQPAMATCHLFIDYLDRPGKCFILIKLTSIV